MILQNCSIALRLKTTERFQNSREARTNRFRTSTKSTMQNMQKSRKNTLAVLKVCRMNTLSRLTDFRMYLETALKSFQIPKKITRQESKDSALSLKQACASATNVQCLCRQKLQICRKSFLTPSSRLHQRQLLLFRVQKLLYRQSRASVMKQKERLQNLNLSLKKKSAR